MTNGFNIHFSFFVQINKLYLVLEYMKQGDLVQLLKDREVTNNAAASAAPNLPLIAGESAGSSAASASQPTVSAVTGKLTSASGYTLLTDIEFWNIFRQVTAGVRYLHLQNIVHGDIKPQVNLRLLSSAQALMSPNEIVASSDVFTEFTG
jgi:serine/threonine protein kinase